MFAAKDLNQPRLPVSYTHLDVYKRQDIASEVGHVGGHQDGHCKLMCR